MHALPWVIAGTSVVLLGVLGLVIWVHEGLFALDDAIGAALDGDEDDA